MKIGRTNAIAISGGGGTTESDYDLWQEGFGVNWDNVIANAPIGSQKVLHLYQKRKFLKLVSTFPSTAQCCVWSKNTNAYRVVELDGNKTIIFEDGESFVNSHDGDEYLCVVYSGSWISATYFYKLPVVYVNSRACTGSYQDFNANCLFIPSTSVPLLRGVDCYSMYRIYIHPSLEHLGFQTVRAAGIMIDGVRGGDVQGRILMNIYDAKPELTPMDMRAHQTVVINFSNLDLADDFYTKISVYPVSNTYYAFPTTNNTRRFKFDSSFNLRYTAGYVGNPNGGIPSAEFLEGTITENQEYTGSVGLHGFNKSDWTVLRNFPMWTVLDGAATGCLRPAGAASSYANFVFYSNQLEGMYFAQFDANGNIDLDPTNTFVANLPFLTGNVAQKITFDDKTFVNQFTPAEQDAIEDLVVNQKKWILEWR